MTGRGLRRALAGLALLFTMSAGGQSQPLDRIAASLARNAGPLHLPPEVRRLPAVAYGDAPRQHLDVYLPSNPERAPIVLMVHGGAWMVGNAAMPPVVENKVAHWVPAGAIFVSVDYRMAPAFSPAQQADDIRRALARVQALAPSWGGDPARLVLMGHSAGAHLVALVAATPALAQRSGARAWLGTVALDSAALDLPALMSRPHPRFYDRVFGADPAGWAAASPADAVDALEGSTSPILLVCSTQRVDGSCEQARAFAARAAAKGMVTSVSPQNLAHDQINSTLGLPGAETEAVDAFLVRIGWR